jgi:hypothetical protein
VPWQQHPKRRQIVLNNGPLTSRGWSWRTSSAARNAGDYWGAAGWCAALLELQDVDGSCFVETATTSDWLRQLTAEYVLDTLCAPVADGNIVTWTERLTPRSMHFPDAVDSSRRIEVHAVIRDGKIGYLSAPYPPFPLRKPGAAATEPSNDRSGAVIGVEPLRAAFVHAGHEVDAASIWA